MATTTTSDRVVRPSNPYVVYKAWTSKMTLMTGVFNISGGTAGVRSRIGPFDDVDDQVTNPQGGDGYFFELSGTSMGIVYRTGATGSQVDTRVEQADWNFDTFDGSGPSRITITTWEDAFLLVFDQQWLGVGQVRVGLMIEGIIHYANIFTNAGLQLPYTRSAKLPIRYEIENVSAGASTGDEMRMMCQSVLYEAEPSSVYKQFTKMITVGIGPSPNVPMLSLQLKDAFNRVTLRLVSILVSTNTADSDMELRLFLNTTLTDEDFMSVGPDSAAEFDEDASVISGGTIVATGALANGTVGFLSLTDGGNRSPLLDINSDIAGTSDILTLTGTRSVAMTVNVAMTWLEIY